MNKFFALIAVFLLAGCGTTYSPKPGQSPAQAQADLDDCRYQETLHHGTDTDIYTSVHTVNLCMQQKGYQGH